MTEQETKSKAAAPIVVMGATSGIGKLAVEEALSRGHSVRAFARSAGDMEARERLELCPGDALNEDDVAGVLEGARAVIYALGIRERLAMLWEEETLFSRTTDTLLRLMEASGPHRLVVVTGFGAGRSLESMSWVEKTGHRAILGRPYADKDRQEALIMQSPLDWTIARPVILTNNKATGRYRVLRDPAQWRNGLISRADVAHYLIEAVEAELDVQADVVLAR